MALSEQDKQRIREEESYRLQVREEIHRAANDGNRWKTVVFWVVTVAVAIVLYAYMRRGTP